MSYANESAPTGQGRGAGQSNADGLRGQYSADYRGVIGPVARELCGEANAKLSSATELRFGTHGSLSVDLEKDTWYDHEADEGGGVLDLVTRHTGRQDGKRWLVERGYLRDEVPRSASPAAVYDYADENGEILFQVERRDGHKFLQRKPDGTYKVRGVRQVPYRLPDLLARPDELVIVAEGEKDVNNLHAAGLLATCNAGGAGKWRDHHAEFLKGRDVVILPDNDEPGRDHADKVRESLRGIARSVRVLELPGLPDKGDVSDWLAAGGTAEALVAMLPNSGTTCPDIPERRLVEVDVSSAMTAAVPAPQFVIKPLVPRGTATLLGAHGGSGKSTLALTWCAHVAAGWGWAGHAVEGGKAVFVSLEDPAGVVLFRLQRIVQGYGLHWPDVAERVRVLDGTDVEAALVTEVNDHGTRMLVPTPVMQEVEDAAEGAALVVIDNASDGFDGDENNRRQVRAFVRRLAQIAKANNAGMVLLAHIDKHAARNGGRGNTYSGSTAWHNSARSRLAMTQDEGSDLITLQQEKLNLGKKAEPITLAWSDNGVLIPYKVAPGERQEAARQQADEDAAAILRVLELAAKAGLDIPTARTGQRTTWHALCELPEMPDSLRDKRAGKARVQAALTALERSKRIFREGYETRHRKSGERWALAQIELEDAA